jgi:hypothetical protein
MNRITANVKAQRVVGSHVNVSVKEEMVAISFRVHGGFIILMDIPGAETLQLTVYIALYPRR